MNRSLDVDPPSTGALANGAHWHLEGRLMEASNVVLRLVALDEPAKDPEAIGSDAPRAVYKPVRGETPLADFPAQTLAHREVATWLVCSAMGWQLVPETHWFEGEFGEGSLQRWVGPLVGTEQTLVSLLDEDEFELARGVHPVAAFEGEDGPLVLVHDATAALRHVAILDIVTNNADRKGSHLIEADGELFAIDNGLTFHVEDKLRTVLWGFAGEALGDDATAALRRLLERRDAVTDQLSSHLDAREIDAFHARTDALLAAGVFPEPPEQRYGLPWPPL